MRFVPTLTDKMVVLPVLVKTVLMATDSIVSMLTNVALRPTIAPKMQIVKTATVVIHAHAMLVTTTLMETDRSVKT